MQIDVHVIYNRSNTTIKLEMRPGDTDAPLYQIPIFSKTNANRHFMNKGQSLWKPQDKMDHFET